MKKHGYLNIYIILLLLFVFQNIVVGHKINLAAYGTNNVWYKNTNKLGEIIDEDNGSKLYCAVSDFYGTTLSDTVSLTINKNSGDTLILAQDSIANYSIFYSENEESLVKDAAIELSQWLSKITGALFNVTTDESFIGPKIIVGHNNPFAATIINQIDIDSIKNDGFKILIDNKNLFITGAIDRGTVYGIYYLLDAYFGIRWFSPEFEVVPHKTTLLICGPVDDLQNPRFVYREIFNADTEDKFYRYHNRLNGSRGGTHRETYDIPSEMWSKDGPYGGHNFQDIVSETYHYGGQILAMSNSVRAEAAAHFNSEVSSKGAEYWYGFSQEDWGWVPDPSSQSFANSHGNALSAPIADLLTNVATNIRETHPNAHLSTLAYQWSFAPPTNMAIPEFVMVETAPIDADFGYPYNHSRNSNFDFEQWNKVASTLGIWDYITNYQNYLQPLPNIYPMCQNIQYLATLGAMKAYFGQSSYNTKGAEFAELRAWVASRLLWNPNQDYMALIEEFCDGYYGQASTYIKQYIALLHQSQQDTEDRISVKQRITSDYLDIDFIMKADDLLASAEAAVTGDYVKHVHEVRLGVDMTILLREHMYEAEAIGKGITWVHDASRRTRFNQYALEAGITYYNEGSSISQLYKALDVNRINPPIPDIAEGLDENDYIDFQDLDYKICCGANIIEDTKASDNGAVKKGSDGQWAIQMSLDLLPTEGKWELYAYVRATGTSGTALSMGVYPGSDLSINSSEFEDGNYHRFLFPGGPYSFETGRSVWFSRQTGTIYIDRIVAVREGVVSINDKKKNNARFQLEIGSSTNSVTDIFYTIPNDSKVKLTVYDSLGRNVKTLLNSYIKAGTHSISFDTSQLNNGVYLYTLEVHGEQIYKKTMKITHLK